MASILIIDDNEQTRRLIREILEHAGHTVQEAENGADGIQLARNHPTDLVITDILMPEKEGLETILDLRNEFPHIKIIAISGGTERAHVNILDIAKKLGAHRTILKPFEMKPFLETVSEVLENSPT